MYVYLIGAYNRFGKGTGIKVGVTADVVQRVRHLQTGNSDTLRMIAYWDASSQAKAYAVEADTHRKFQHHRMVGEWFYYKKLDKLIYWLSEQFNAGPSFMDGELCFDYLSQARNREMKRRAKAA